MHSLFGVEPSVINNWPDFRYVFEKFGFSKGVLIAQVPKTWSKLVLQECEANTEVSDVQKARIVERLQQAKQDRLFRLGAPYQPEKSWIENIQSEVILPQLKGVMTSSEVENKLFHTLDDLAEELFENSHQFRVKRTAAELSQAARFLVSDVVELVIVDAYFQPRHKCFKVLSQLIAISREYSDKLTNVIIYTTEHVENGEYQDIIRQFSLEGIHFKVIEVDKRHGQFDIHARYLLTVKAGLNYDRGFIEPEDRDQREHLTQISCLTQRLNQELLSIYSLENKGLPIIQIIELET